MGEVLSLPVLFRTLLGPFGDLQEVSSKPPPLKSTWYFNRANWQPTSSGSEFLGHLKRRCSMYALFTFHVAIICCWHKCRLNYTKHLGNWDKFYISTCLTSSSFPAHSPRATIFSQLVAGWIAEPLMILKIFLSYEYSPNQSSSVHDKNLPVKTYSKWVCVIVFWVVFGCLWVLFVLHVALVVIFNPKKTGVLVLICQTTGVWIPVVSNNKEIQWIIIPPSKGAPSFCPMGIFFRGLPKAQGLDFT